MSKLHPIKSGVPQGSVLSNFIYPFYRRFTNRVLTETFADDTAMLAVDKNPVEASKNCDEVGTWATKRGIKMNETKSVHITFTTRTESCPPVYINITGIPSSNEVKYLGMYLDRRLKWKAHKNKATRSTT